MKKYTKKEVREWLDNFNMSASITYKENVYTITEQELTSIYSPGHYWHHKTDPGSWLCGALVNLAKRKFQKNLPGKKVIRLCAQLLNITPEKLESTLDWNAHYLAWHDGGTPEDYHVWNEK